MRGRFFSVMTKLTFISVKRLKTNIFGNGLKITEANSPDTSSLHKINRMVYDFKFGAIGSYFFGRKWTNRDCQRSTISIRVAQYFLPSNRRIKCENRFEKHLVSTGWSYNRYRSSCNATDVPCVPGSSEG